MLTVSRLGISRRCVSSAGVLVARRGAATAIETKQQREERIKKEQERQNAVALERMARSELPMDFDIKMQQLSILDLRYPFPIATAPPGIKGKFTWFLEALRDRFMSITSFRKAYRVGLLPKPSLRQIFTLSSKPFAERALSAYESMNSEFARGDARALARVCSEEQLDRLRQRIKSRPRDQRIEWNKAGEGNVKVVSFRTVDAWSSKKPEDHLAQALVRFDTRQSLAVYSPSGKLLSGDPKKVVPVQEYMIMERKNWSEGDWMLRKSIPPNPPANLANA